MDTVKELLTNAEVAFSNKQYEVALTWYQKVLEQTPDDLYVLSRAGAICVPLGKLDEAAGYFGRARELDPENGDNTFNYANACFFSGDYAQAFSLYVEAEKLGCSGDVKPRLYYQMAMLCSMRQDMKSALVYFGKCEESDSTGMMSMNPDLISEKLKMYMLLEDYISAEKCAAQLVAINPTEFRNYMVYFSIAMSHRHYDVAESLLSDAGSYAELTDSDRFSLVCQKASLYVTQAENGADRRIELFERAIALLNGYSAAQELTPEQNAQLRLAKAETYYKAEQYDRAIPILQTMLSGLPAEKPAAAEDELEELSYDELEAMLDQDMSNIQDLIDRSILADDLGAYCETQYDENGVEVNCYPADAFEALGNQVPAPKQMAAQPAQGYVLPADMREKIVFLLLSCYMAKDSVETAQSFAKALRHSNNKYYSYFGLYTDALTERKLTGNSQQTDRKYAEAIAFFRSKVFADKTDTLASVFRARLYAEQGSYEKAKEIASLLADADRQTVLDYIEQCRQA